MWRLKSCRALTNIKKLLPRRQRRSSTIRRRRGVPDDVKKGHFAVVVRSGAGDQLTRRAVVPLRCLRNPEFVKLLEQAADEYGFRSQGTITVCCRRPADFDGILGFDGNGL
ncbi:Protein SMALL AUXIN UP-REGULATED RNA 16 [Linum perenne]